MQGRLLYKKSKLDYIWWKYAKRSDLNKNVRNPVHKIER